MDIIKALQENEKPFVLLSSGEQIVIMRAVDHDGAELLCSGIKEIWKDVNKIDWNCERNWNQTYRLRADYTEEPERKCSGCKHYKERCSNCLGVGGLPKWEATEEPEIEEWPIFTNGRGNLAYKRHLAEPDDIGTEIDLAVRRPRFSGFKYESGQVEFQCRVFKSGVSTKSICQFRDLGGFEVLTPTHVLFRKTK